MATRNTTVIGAYAGGVQALSTLIADLPARRTVERARKSNHMRAANMFARRAQEAEEYSSMIRRLLLAGEKGDIGDAALQTGND